MINCSDSRPVEKPLVSVIVPAYKAASFITQTLESVFAQTLKDFEVIIINDGSPDTEEFERILQPYMSRVTYLKQENRGPSAARNLGIMRARGEYVALLDADDLWLPEYLNEQMKLFKQKPSLDLVYSDVLQYYSSTADGVPYSQDCPSRGPVTFESLLTEECQIPTSALIVRRQVVQDAGLFDEQLWRCEDYDLWLRIAHRGAQMVHQQKVLGASRVRLDSLAAENIKMLQSMVQVLVKLQTELRITPERRVLFRRETAKAQANVDLERGKVYLQQGRFEEALDALRNANAFFHRHKLTLTLLALRLSPKLAESVSRVWGSLSVRFWRFRNYRRRNWPLSWTARG
jgi:glycosyltransferase involved in cell wall biosynthesis